MARKKKPVDRTPICDRAYQRRIDPLWMPGPVPPRFWEDRAHRRDYLLWSAWRLGLRKMADLYRLDLSRAACRNYGRGMLQYSGDSTLAVVQDCFPEYDWKPWHFPTVPKGFWDVAANRRSYWDWLGKELGFRSPEAWYRIRVSDVASHHGGTLLKRYASFYDLLRELPPDLDWDKANWNRLLQVEEILAWADAYNSRHGTWPTTRSGRVPESGDTWFRINGCLRDGLRGLPGGITLARLLEERRGALFGKRPPLSDEQILAWAHRYFLANSRWPSRYSGPIPQSPGDTWSAMHSALRNGLRGLPGGSSLAKLLRKEVLKEESAKS